MAGVPERALTGVPEDDTCMSDFDAEEVLSMQVQTREERDRLHRFDAESQAVNPPSPRATSPPTPKSAF